MLNRNLMLEKGSWQLNVMLVFPFFMLALCAVEYFVFGNHAFLEYQNIIRFVQMNVFLDGAHVLFTFVMLWGTKEGKETVRFFRERVNYHLVVRSLVIFIAYYTLTYFYFARLFDFNLLLGISVFIFLKAMPIWHSLTQVFGISLHLDPELTGQERKVRKNVFESFIIAVLFNLVCLILWHRSKKLWPDYADILTFLNYASLALVIFYLFYVFYTFDALPGTKKFKKLNMLFLVRLIFYPLTPFTSLVGFSAASVHGIEYACITSAMLKKEKKKWMLYGYLALIVLIFPLFTSPKIFSQFVVKLPRELSLHLLSFSFAITFVHYNLDHFVFSRRYSPEINPAPAEDNASAAPEESGLTYN